MDRYIEVAPETDRYVGRVVGTVDELYGQLVQDGLNGISSDKSLFRTDGGVGHRLSWNEDLYWGDTIVIVCGTETAHEGFLRFANSTALEFQKLRLHPDYKCSEIILPDDSEVPPHIRQSVAEYLDREIRPRRPQVLLLEPAPHHFTEDGEWVVASGTEYIKLYRSQRDAVIVTTSNGDVVPVQELSDDTVEFAVEGDGSYAARLGTNSINIRIAECNFNSASTIRMGNAAERHSIEKLATSEDLRQRLTSNSDDVQVEFSNSGLQGLLFVNGNPWQDNETFKELLRDELVGVVLEVKSYLTFSLRLPSNDEPVESVDVKKGFTDRKQSALQEYFLQYGSTLKGKGPAGILDVGMISSRMRVSPGVLPQLRWLNRRGR